MKKLILIIIISLSCSLFSETIHFRLVNNQDKYDFISNSEFYFDTDNDNIMFARDWLFSKASVDLMYFENLHRIYITDVELFDQNDNFPDSIKDSIWTLKYYFDDVKSNKNSLFKNEPFWKETWDSISVNDYDEQSKDYFEPLLVKIFDICLCIDPVLHNRSNIIFKSVEKNKGAYLITGYNVDKSSKYFYPFLSDYFPYKSQVQYKIVPDGDYLYFYKDDILRLTFVRTNEEMQKEITLYYRNGKCDQSKISWPRHADGTCDYEDVSSVKTVSTPTTNVAKNKTMLISENLNLRSGEATTSEVITVMSAGTRVKITGTNTYIDVEIDGRTAIIAGEMIVGGFVCYKSSMKNWLVPENEPLTEDDKNEIIQKVTEKTAGSHMVITFE